MTRPFSSAQLRLVREMQELQMNNIELEEYLLQCVSLFAQHDMAPPDPPARVAVVLQEKFMNAVKGE